MIHSAGIIDDCNAILPTIRSLNMTKTRGVAATVELHVMKEGHKLHVWEFEYALKVHFSASCAWKLSDRFVVYLYLYLYLYLYTPA